MPRSENQCECESTKCHHGENECKNDAGQNTTVYGTKLCDACAEKMPKEYMKEELIRELIREVVQEEMEAFVDIAQ